MVALDSQGDITLINRKGCEVFGYDEHELLGKSWIDTCLPEGCRNDVRSIFQQLMNGVTANVENFENPVLTKTGEEERIIEWHNSEIRDETGRVVGSLSSGTDITGRRQAERALRDREQRMRAILNTAADAIITIDRRGIITVVNPATEQMFGYTQEELLGQNVKILMPPPYHDEHDGYIQHYLETAEARNKNLPAWECWRRRYSSFSHKNRAIGQGQLSISAANLPKESSLDSREQIKKCRAFQEDEFLSGSIPQG